MSTTTAGPTDGSQPTLQTIPLHAITVKPGFNPRGEVVEDAELQALAQTIRDRGCLQPIRVRRDGEHHYVLIAGERRYRAAVLAGLEQIPASIAPDREGEDGELELLTDAVVENELRRELDPLARALGYRAMLDAGLTVRGVAERLGGNAGRRSREARIKEHLAILKLPQDLRAQVAGGEIPLLAVKALVELCETHEQLARAAVLAAKPASAEEEPYPWSEIAQSPLQIAVSVCEELPPGVFSTRQRYPLGRFELSEKARKDLAEFRQLTGNELQEIYFAAEQVEQAKALGALRQAGWLAVIVGQDVADRLAEDRVAQAVSEARTRVTESHADPVHATAQAAGGPDADAVTEARRERERERQQREQATRFNLALGVLAYKHLSRVKVDARVLRIFASVDVSVSLRGIAARGARLCLPGWVTETQQNNGRQRTSYLEAPEAFEKALEFLAAADSIGEIAGRAITLIALAAYADETALAQSRRSYYTLSFRGPYAEQARQDLREIVRERIPQGALPALEERLTDTSAGS